MLGGVCVISIATAMWLYSASPIYTTEKLWLGILGISYGIFIILGNGFYLVKKVD